MPIHVTVENGAIVPRLVDLPTDPVSAVIAAMERSDYPTTPETLAPDWKQIAEALREELGVLTRALARAKEVNATLEREWAKAAADAADWRDRMAAADTQLQLAWERATHAERERDALIDLVSELAAYVRENGWESDEQADWIKAALRAHEVQYGKRGEYP